MPWFSAEDNKPVIAKPRFSIDETNLMMDILVKQVKYRYF